LHANAVSVFGTGVRRLAQTAEEAAARGLHVWLQPRLGDVPRKDILDHLGEAGRQAEQMRQQGASIDLSVGAEFVLFVPGIVPGADALERVDNLLSGRFDAERMQRRLDAFIADAARVGRSAFGGRLSYAAAEDDVVDWRLFDVVGIDYYSSFPRRSQHVRALRRHTRWGKPVAIAEFGTCAYKGAARRGGMAWDAFDDRGRLKDGLVRSERAQARHIVEVLRVFEALGLDTATVYQFVTPDSPHRSAPRHDIDAGSYAIVKPIWAKRHRPTPCWHWEPKAAFRALAREFNQAGS
ncbi:MAG TPA: abortive phage infection protein, partial [Solirubrobacteraceae bacterium]|nr:abortive phage infection protein [Solirubrobacteraceae bacterium]